MITNGTKENQNDPLLLSASLFSSATSELFLSTTTDLSKIDDLNLKTREEELISLIGPPRDSSTIVILMTIVYLSILITGVTGNLITCLVIARKRYMHTATNYYLFSLAVSDLLLLILGLPHDLVLLWQKYPYFFGETFCIIRGFSSELSTNASILTIIAFTIERYIAICHPLRSHTTLKLRRVIKTIIIIWIISSMAALPIAYQFGIVYILDEDGKAYAGSDQCSVKSLLYKYIFEIATMIFFVIPICIITILYILIGLRLRASSQINNREKKKSSSALSISKKFYQTRRQSSCTSFTTTINSKNNQLNFNNNRKRSLKRAFGQSRTSINSIKIFYSNQLNQDRIKNIQQFDDVEDNDDNQNPKQRQQQQQHEQKKLMQNQLQERKSIQNERYNQQIHLSLSVKRQNASRRAVIKMLVAVVISFFFCYSPFHAQRVLAMVMARNNVTDDNFIYIFTLLTHISGITYYLSSTINPILYQIMSKKFQLALRETLPCCTRYCFRNNVRRVPTITNDGSRRTTARPSTISEHTLNTITNYNNNKDNENDNDNLDVEDDLDLSYTPSPKQNLSFEMTHRTRNRPDSFKYR